MRSTHSNIFELQQNLEKLQPLRFSAHPYHDLRNKLAVIAVKASYKQAFMEFGENAKIIVENMGVFERVGLKVKVTGLPPPYLHGTPKVPPWFLKEYSTIVRTERQQVPCVWIYVKENIESKIMSSINGELNEGYVLNYPDCCIRWYGEMWRRQVEVLYRYIPARYATKSRYELLEALRQSKAREFTYNLFQIWTDANLAKTVKKFPFVFHNACERCLKGLNSFTLLINEQNKHLALNLGHAFHEEILKTSLSYVQQLEEKRITQLDGFIILKEKFPWLRELWEITE